MTRVLPDGTVVSSVLGCRSVGIPGNTGIFGQGALMSGEIKDIIYPSDTRSRSQKFVEYEVNVQYRDGSGPGVSRLFTSCFIDNLFGGIADKLSFTLRKDPIKDRTGDGVGVGSKVLLLCVDGDLFNAVILGGLRDPTDPNLDSQGQGHNLFFEFNGVKAVINDAGELTLTYLGKTKVDGTLDPSANSAASGSTIVLSKDGSVTSTSPDGKQIIKINHATHKLSIAADAELDITSNGKVVIKSTGVLNGGATDAWILGTTYRSAEDMMLSNISSSMAIVSSSLASASAAPSFSVAQPFLSTAGLALAKAVLAITAFQASASNYISKTNLTD